MIYCLFFFLFFNIDEIENIIGGVCGIFFLGIVVYFKICYRDIYLFIFKRKILNEIYILLVVFVI